MRRDPIYDSMRAEKERDTAAQLKRVPKTAAFLAELDAAAWRADLVDVRALARSAALTRAYTGDDWPEHVIAEMRFLCGV